jgi:hypothetical protein
VPDIFIIKPTRCTNFTNIFWHEILHVSDSSSVHHQSLFTVYPAMVYVIQVCRQLSSRTRMELSIQWINSWWWTEELSETRRISCQNNFANLVHLVGFIIKKFVTKHGHTKVKKMCLSLLALCYAQIHSHSFEPRLSAWISSEQNVSKSESVPISGYIQDV